MPENWKIMLPSRRELNFYKNVWRYKESDFDLKKQRILISKTEKIWWISVSEIYVFFEYQFALFLAPILEVF